MNANDFGMRPLLKAVELGKKPIKTIITNALSLTLEGTKKLVIEVEGMEQQIVLNVTRRTALMGAYGPETDDWIGKSVTIVQGRTKYGKDTVPTIEIQVPGKQRPKQMADAPSEDDGYSGQFDS